MSDRSKSCPNCLSNSLLETSPHEFECKSCGHQFSFNKPDESVTTKDVKGHYCPFCGASTSGGQGHKCTGCSKIDFCNNCVHRSPDKLYCNDCLKKNKQNCLDCGTYAEFYCQSCSNISKKIQKEDFLVERSCKSHQSRFYNYTFADKDSNRKVAVMFNCPKCGGVCKHCTIKQEGFFTSNVTCKFCKSKLKEVKRWAN